MDSIKSVFAAMGKNFKTWRTNPRIYVVLALLLLFHWNTFHEYGEIAEFLGVPISVCVFPFFLTGTCKEFIFGIIPMLLFSGAPFADRYAPFMVIRTGRRKWIIGQVMYVLVSSFLYTIISFLISILVMLPNVQFEFDWGKVLWTMAVEPARFIQAGFTCEIPNDAMMYAMSGLQGLLLSLLLYWLGTTFLGMVIVFFNIVVKKGIGLLVSGFFVGFSYFAHVFGNFRFGSIVKWFSPVTWRTYKYLALGDSLDYPPIPYAITVLSVSIIIMAVVSVIVFCKKDLEFEKGEY